MDPTLEDCLRAEVPSRLKVDLTPRGRDFYLTFYVGRVGETYVARLSGNSLTMITPSAQEVVEPAASPATPSDDDDGDED